MGFRRVKVHGEGAVYHCMSRIVAGERLLHRGAKETLRKQIWQVSDFCGVEVLTYCIMGNHFHLLVRVPARQEVSDQELLRRFTVLYYDGKISLAALERMLERDEAEAARWRRRMLARMGDLSMFMKMLKQRFSIWYNRSHERFGTLWAERFKSVLVEDINFAVEIVAAYIDLNPVRAGLSFDPKDYRFCGYGEAVGGSERARRGIRSCVRTGARDWQTAIRDYRMALFGKGAIPARSGQPYMSRKQARKVIESGGSLSRVELLRCRVRYFTDGVVMGTREYVEEQFEVLRRDLGPRRRSGPRKMRGGDWGGLTVLRELQKDVIS